MPRAVSDCDDTGSERSLHGQFAPSMKDTVSRLSIKIVCQDHPKERARKLMAEGGSDWDGGTGTFLGIQ
jgi:hypothetical protein